MKILWRSAPDINGRILVLQFNGTDYVMTICNRSGMVMVSTEIAESEFCDMYRSRHYV
jgi:hypothetical protein